MSKGRRRLVPGTEEHEKAVKKVLETQVEKSVEMLEHLDILEAQQLDIGNAFLAFRFKAAEVDQEA